jgi:murein L,D-transpeptidase YcbB/YkuD
LRHIKVTAAFRLQTCGVLSLQDAPLPRHRLLFGLAVGLFSSAMLAAAPGLADVQTLSKPGSSAALTPADALAIVAAIGQAPELTVRPDLAESLTKFTGPDPEARAQAEASLILAAQALAAAEHGQLAAPQSVDHDWALRAPYDAVADFAAARSSSRVAAWAAGLPRRDPAYLALVAARQRYAAIVAAGGWDPLPEGPALKPGATDPRTPALRARLAAEGYVVGASAPVTGAAPGPDPRLVYDRALAAAVTDFQGRHLLTTDGALSAATVAALNVPAKDRLVALDANLERSRWLPDRLPVDRIEVDVAAAQLTLFQGGRSTMTMRVIVGDPKHHTPIFVSKVVSVVFNPPWVVPDSIAQAEIYPKARRSPGYFARNGFSVINGQIVQAPGPKASLGYVKFDIVSPFGVYLHDTPARSLFDRGQRALSHGCMRLQNPRGLAAALLASKGWSLDSVNAAITVGATLRVTPASQTPVYVVYRTAEADDGRPAVFRPDVYRWDAELAEAIGRR